MAKIVKGKDYDEIEQLFTYYTLLKEIKTLNKADPENVEVNERKAHCEERIKLLRHDLSR